MFSNQLESQADKFLKDCKPYKETSLASDSLSIDYITYHVVSDTNLKTYFDYSSPQMLYEDGENKGIFYFPDVVQESKRSYKVTAYSVLKALSTMQHAGGIYTGETVEEVVLDICGPIPVIVKTILKDIKLYGWLPYTDARTNLSNVLFAIGGHLGTDLNGVLRVETLWDTPASTILPRRMYTGGSVNREPPVTSITVKEHQYYPGDEETQLFEGTAQEGDIITFSEPAHSLTSSGFEILESGANYAKVSAGAGTLHGKKYVHNTRNITREITTATSKNDIVIDNATLVSVTNSNAVTEWMVDYYACRETIENPIVADAEKPGDVVMIYHPYDRKLVSACIRSADSTLSTITKSDTKALVGFVPPQKSLEQSVIYEKELIITEDGEITLPSNVHNLRAVLIGGGNGGVAGSNGTSGTRGTDASIKSGESGTKYGNVGTPGKGGAGGVGGAGGKVLILDIELQGGEPIKATIGAGGFGSKYGDAKGGATTLQIGNRIYSSDNGGSSDMGFVDTITGEKYAYPGVAGTGGADGGTAATSITAKGNSGGSAGGKAGSAGSAGYTTSKTNSSQTNNGVQNQYEETTGSHDWTGFLSDNIYDSTRLYGYPSYVVNSSSHYASGSGTRQYVGADSYDTSTKRYTLKEGTVYDIKSSSSTAKPSGTGTQTFSTLMYKYTAKKRVSSTTSFDYTESYVYSRVVVGYTGYSATLTTGYTGSGGNGASGTMSPAPSPFQYGCGGNGGAGGGGGGAGGAGYASATGDVSKISLSGTGSGQAGKSGNSGSNGTNGIQGCIILYYGETRELTNGQFVTKDYQMLLGKNKHRFVV